MYVDLIEKVQMFIFDNRYMVDELWPDDDLEKPLDLGVILFVSQYRLDVRWFGHLEKALLTLGLLCLVHSTLRLLYFVRSTG